MEYLHGRFGKPLGGFSADFRRLNQPKNTRRPLNNQASPPHERLKFPLLLLLNLFLYGFALYSFF